MSNTKCQIANELQMTKFQIIKQRCADRSFYGIAARIIERHGCTVKKPKPNNDIRNGLRNRMPINEQLEREV